MPDFIVGSNGRATVTDERAQKENQRTLDNIFKLAAERPPEFRPPTPYHRGPIPVIMVQEPTHE